MKRKFSRTYTSVLLGSVFMLSLQLCGCGGGGGGGGTDYSGTWSFQGTKFSDACKSSLGPTMSLNWIVSQNGSDITVQSGSLTLTGAVNDKDGFDASLAREGSRGCLEGISLGTREASDGSAIAAVAIGVQCGKVTCVVGYGGTATRTSSKSLDTRADSITIESVTNSVSESTTTTDTGLEGGLLSALEETQMEIEKQQTK